MGTDRRNPAGLETALALAYVLPEGYESPNTGANGDQEIQKSPKQSSLEVLRHDFPLARERQLRLPLFCDEVDSVLHKIDEVIEYRIENLAFRATSRREISRRAVAA